MKKLFFAVVFLVAGAVNAQQLDFGAKAGVNFATFHGDSPFDVTGETGYHLGLVAELKFSDKFSLQPEVLYSIQGAKAEFNLEGVGSVSQILEFHYVSIPLMLKYYLVPGLALEAGPQVGFLVKAESEYSYDFLGDTDSGTRDIKDESQSLDFGLGGGLSFEFPMGLFFSGRYNVSFTDVIKDFEDFEFEEDIKAKHSVIQLSVGFKF